MGMILERLFELQDEKYRDFHSKLMPTVNKDNIIGIRTPLLRKFAKEIKDTAEANEFLKELPHKYYEENNLHAFLIEAIKDFNQAVKAVEEFLPYIDNWATCDFMFPKSFRKHPQELIRIAVLWTKSSHTYTIRYGVGTLMRLYLDENFKPEYLNIVACIKSDEYYVNMMIAWYFATALAKQYKDTIPFIEQHRLDKWTNNKAIQKSIESYRITDEQKKYLRTLKI